MNFQCISFTGFGLFFLQNVPGSERLNPSICICCGEPMARSGGVLSRNPNMCASCSSIADGSQESGPTVSASAYEVDVSALADSASVRKPDALPETAELAVANTTGAMP